MTADQFIALAASIGSCLAAIATFLTVRQMSKQRADSYHPEFVISSVNVEGRSAAEAQLPSTWIVTDKNSDGKTNGRKSELRFGILLSNIGLGAAKDIVVSWNFSIEEITEHIKELARSSQFPAKFDFADGRFSINSKVLLTYTSVWENQKTTEIDYVLPATVQHEPTLLPLPDAYITTCSALLHLICLNKTLKSFPDFPTLKVDISFRDIADRKHGASFDIEMEFIGWSADQFFGFLQSTKRT